MTAADATWENSTVISGDVAAEISGLKGQIAGDILVAGSGQLDSRPVGPDGVVIFTYRPVR
jgi:hypothetical protein